MFLPASDAGYGLFHGEPPQPASTSSNGGNHERQVFTFIGLTVERNRRGNGIPTAAQSDTL